MSTFRTAQLVTSYLLAALSLLAAPTRAAEYTFVNIADSDGPFADFHFLGAPFIGAPAINDSGGVAFRARVDTGELGIFTGGTPATDTVATTSGPYQNLPGINSLSGGAPALNNAGVVAFQATLDTGIDGIYRGPDPATDIVADEQGSYGSFSVAHINNAGTIAFRAALDNGASGIFTGADPAASAIVTTTTTPYTGIFGTLALNDVGGVVFSASHSGSTGLFTGPDPATDTLVTNAGPFSGFGGVDMNDAGTIAFRGFLDGGSEHGIFTGPDPLADAVATTGAFSAFDGGVGNPDGPGINDAGLIAFHANLDAGGHGIFIGPDPLADQVIRTGDPLFGSTVTAIAFYGQYGLNDSGQVAFQYNLADGREGIAIATPVPEPAAAVVVVALAAVPVLLSCRARRRGR